MSAPWYPNQQQPGFQYSQQTGFQQGVPTGYSGGGSGFLQPQRTGFPSPAGFNQQSGGIPPVPPIPPNFPPQFQQQSQLQPPQQQFGQNGSLSGIMAQQRFLSPSPALGGPLSAQATGFNGSNVGGIQPLISQPTGFSDPRLQMMSSTFMPANIQAPFAPSGAPQFAGGLSNNQSLQQSFQQHNEAQRGTIVPKVPWVLSKEERKNYDQIFRAWDPNTTGFISGETATEVFSQSGLDRNELAQIWALADSDNRGKLNIQEFHVAMGLIYRRLNGNEIPAVLPPELEPVSSKHLGESVDFLKDLLKNDNNVRVTNSESKGKIYSFRDSPTPKTNPRKDGTIYKHDDSNVRGYSSSSRRVDRSSVRSGETTPSDDLSDIKRQLESTNKRLDKERADTESRTAEDEALDAELDDLKYRVRRVQEDLDHVGRGSRSAAKDQERRKLERELMYLMHEKVPEVERKIEERDRRKKREREEWARERDRRNDRYRYEHDSSPRRRSSGRGDSSSDGETDQGYLRGTYDRKDSYRDLGHRDDGSKHKRDHGRDYHQDSRDHSPERSRDRGHDRDRSYDRRAPAPLTRSPASPPPAASSPRNEPRKPTPVPIASPALSTKPMSSEERAAYIRQQAQQRLQERMKALGLSGPSPSSPMDTSVEDRLEKERKEAEEKALQAEKDAEERERVRKERLNALRAPPPAAPSPPNVIQAKPAPQPPGKKAPPAPPPPRPPRTKSVPTVVPKPVPVPKLPKVVAPDPDEEDEEEKRRLEGIAKRRAARQAELQRLEDEARREEEEHQKRIEALRASQRGKLASPSPQPIPAPTPSISVVSPRDAAVPLAPPPPPLSVPSTNPPNTNPFHRLTQSSSASSPSSIAPQSNPWGTPETPASPLVPPASAIVPVHTEVAPPRPPPPAPVPPQKSLSPTSSPESPLPSATKNPYAVSGSAYKPPVLDDWDDPVEKDSGSDSSDDEPIGRSAHAEIANVIFGGIVRPQSAATEPSVSDASAPSPAPPAPPAPKVPALAFKKSDEPDRGAVFSAITAGALKLRKTVTNDRSGVATAGSVIGGDVKRSPHIPNTSSPYPPVTANEYDEPHEIVAMTSRKSEITTDQPISEENEEGDLQMPVLNSSAHQNNSNDVSLGGVSDDLMADIDANTTHSVRSLYAYDGQRTEDISFGENLIIIAHPSKSGSDWWYGTLVSSGKHGFFPASYVAVIDQAVRAKAIYTYTSTSAEELPFNEGDVLSIVEKSEGDWWKAQKDGIVFLVPAAYLEVTEVTFSFNSALLVCPFESKLDRLTLVLPARDFMDEPQMAVTNPDDYGSSDGSEYVSFSESEDDDGEGNHIKTEDEEAEAHREAAERTRILDAAGLILKVDKTKPPLPPPLIRKRSVRKRRSVPPIPFQKGPSPTLTAEKELPPTPNATTGPILQSDDAFDRYEQYQQQRSPIQRTSNRQSVVSIDSIPPSPASASYSIVSSQSKDDGNHRSGSSGFFHFLQKAGARATTALGSDKKGAVTVTAPVISGPFTDGGPSVQRSNGSAFGSSWSSLVDKSALEGIPSTERRRQEAMFELITTESGYVRDLQLVVETFYAPLLGILTEQELVGVFANIEELLLCNTTFLSSLEGRQKESRLYIDSISDILEEHAPGFDIYSSYCVGQGPAIKLLQNLRSTKPELDAYLQKARNDPATRNLDLPSYLLIPMQRITRYPLLLKQISTNTQSDEDRDRIDSSIHAIEHTLDNINERIRVREGQERLAEISKYLWIGQGQLDLTAVTRYMGPRKLIKEGLLVKAKSGRRLRVFLCNDILVLTDENPRSIYRMPIPLTEMQVSEPLGTRDDTAFQISVAYPRGGDIIKLRAPSAKDCQDWIRTIERASARCRRAARMASQTGP